MLASSNRSRGKKPTFPSNVWQQKEKIEWRTLTTHNIVATMIKIHIDFSIKVE